MKVNRIIGRYSQEKEGPLFLGLAGVHGNELAGMYAINRILRSLKEEKIPFKGEFVGISGNPEAILRGKRFIDMDLNRLWTDEQIETTLATPKWKLKTNEERQQKDLLRLFDRVLKYAGSNEREVVLIDMHTTSAFGGIPFAIADDTEESRDFALNLHIPVIAGLGKVITGTTLNYFHDKNLCAFGIEAGQHNDPVSKDMTESAIWLSLVKMGCLETESVPNYEEKKNLLKKSSQNIPSLVEFSYRHHVNPQDNFEMRPGYKNFQAVSKGEELAKDKNGKVLSPVDGLILMPLYQKQGQDGFFIAEAVKSST